MPYMIIILIIILLIVVFFLAIKLWLVKRQLRKMAEHMKEQEEDLFFVDFVDRDLEMAVLHMNRQLERTQKIKVDAAKKEQAIKTAISMISHDMRTPLTSVIGYLQLAERNCREEETLQDIRIALDRAKYANKLVDDFFELSVVDANQYTPVMEQVNLCEIVCEEILANYLSFEKKGITPIFEQADEKILVWADKKLLIRVIQNLISNGIKYSAGVMKFVITEGEKITLSISNSVTEDMDTEKIFEKFYRADASRKGDGAGLGLYICRKLVEEMNGTISAECGGKVLTIKIQMG